MVLDGEEGDLERVHEARVTGRVVELVEARVDPEWIPDTQRLVEATLGAGVRSFWELAPSRALAGEVAAVREARAGAKIRCGGASVPSVAEVAAFVAACRDAGVPFKATAGLAPRGSRRRGARLPQPARGGGVRVHGRPDR